MERTTKIGWIGLGKMGIPMTQQLIKAGYPVTVYNRHKDKETALKSQGVSISTTPAALIEHSDMVFVMVTDDQAIRDVFTGDNGLLGTKATGKIIINMSTVSPGISREMAALCAGQGNHYLDAPVSGSVRQAEEGQLVIMAGGDEEAFTKAKPVLEHIGKLAMWLGAAGSGNSAKLAINSLLGIQAQGLAETVIFARQNGIKTEDLITLINNSALGSIFLRIKGDAIAKDNYQAAFALKHLVKDLRLAKDEGLASPLGTVTLETFQKAESAFGEEDLIAVIRQIQV